MDNKKRLLFGLLFLWCILGCSVGGFFVGKMMKNVNEKKGYGPLEEISDVLIANHYSSPNENDLMLGAIKGMTQSLDDPYTYYYSYEDSKTPSVALGISVSVRNGQVVVANVLESSSAAEKRVFPGDIIEFVDSKKVSDMTMLELSNALSKSKGETVEITFKRGEISYTTTLTFAEQTDEPVSSKMLDNKIGYIHLKEFNAKAVTSFIAQLSFLEEADMKNLIIDVRDNPGGTLDSVNDILRLFLTGNKTYLRVENVREKDTNRNTYYRPYSSTVKKSYDIKILINERSASAAEIFALAMNSVEGYDLIGKNSYGKNVFQADYKMETMKNCFLHITLGNWYGPNDLSVKANGITPTYNVEIPNCYYLVAPEIFSNISIDSVNAQTKNIQLMLKTLGNDVRVDGYFDSNMQTILNDKYNSVELSSVVAKEIYEDYLLEIEKDIYDTQLRKAISLLEVD